MGNRNKYLDKVVEYLVDDTIIEIREDGNYISFPFFEGTDKYYPLGNSFLPTNFFYRPTSFFEYCRDMYGLTVYEIEDMWEKYRTTIRNRVSKRNINESVDRKDDYLNRVTQFIVDDTVLEYTSYGTIKFIPPFFKGYRYYEYEKNQEFILPFYVPSEFIEYCNNVYGLTWDGSIVLWGKYKKLLSHTYQQSINESVVLKESKMVNLIERVLDLEYPDLSDCYYDWAEYNCGMGVCCDPYAVGFVLPDKEHYQYLFKLVESGYYDDMGKYPKELSEDLPEVCYEPPNIHEIEFDTILVGEEIFELLNDHFNDPKIWWNQLLFILNNRFGLNATKIGIGIF